MSEVIIFSDIVEDNGKTIRENNMEIPHNIPIGTLVEVTMEKWHGGGACEVTKARLWVVDHHRDCDGTPLYSLCKRKDLNMIGFNGQMRIAEINEDNELVGLWKEDISKNIYHDVHNGYTESSLKVVKVTERLKKGYGQLTAKKVFRKDGK